MAGSHTGWSFSQRLPYGDRRVAPGFGSCVIAERALGAFTAEVERAEDIAPPDVEAAVCQCVGRLAATLKPEYAETLRGDQLAVHRFSTDQGISNGNATVRIFRARKALRRRVMASCGTCAEHGCIDCTCKHTDPG